MCAGAPQKRSEKIKGAVRLGHLYTILAKSDTMWKSDYKRKGIWASRGCKWWECKYMRVTNGT